MTKPSNATSNNPSSYQSVDYEVETLGSSSHGSEDGDAQAPAAQAPAIGLYNPRPAPNIGVRNNNLLNACSLLGAASGVYLAIFGFYLGATTAAFSSKVILFSMGAAGSLGALKLASDPFRRLVLNQNAAPQAPQNEADIENNIQPDLQNQVESEVAPAPENPSPNLVNLLSRTLNTQANFPGNHCDAIFRAIESAPGLQQINNQDLLAIVNRVFSDGAPDPDNLQNGDRPLTIAIEDFRRELGQSFREVNIPAIPGASVGNKRVIQAISCAIIHDKLRNHQHLSLQNLPNINLGEFRENCKGLNQNIANSLPVAERALFATASLMIEDLLDNGIVDASVRQLLAPNQINAAAIEPEERGIRPESYETLSASRTRSSNETILG